LPTREEIKTFYAKEHDRITKAYYQDKTLDAPTFQSQHTQNWEDLQQALLSAGYANTIWHYSISATMTTLQGPLKVVVTLDSPTQLSATDKAQYLQALKNASWAVESEISEIAET